MKVANTPTENQTYFASEALPKGVGSDCKVVEPKHSAVEVDDRWQVPPHRFGGPTQQGGDVTNPSDSSGYAKDPLAELKCDPEYIDLLAQLEFFRSIQDGLCKIDQQYGGAFGSGLNDNLVNLGNIEAAANDSASPGHAAAMKLLANPRFRAMIDTNGDGLFGSAELTALIGKLKAQKKEMEGAATSPPASPGPGSPPAPTATQTSTAGEGNTTTAAAGQQAATAQEGKELTAEEVTQALNQKTPRPAMTVGGGLEGAVENTSKTLGWMESELDRLSVLAGQTSDPKVLREIEAQTNKLTRQAQTVASMMNQLMTMISNISKMFSDVAMNSIRNMR